MDVEAVHQRLLDWYGQHGRDLPWRRTRDPYAVLVSEIMLQQTQVDRVIPKWQAWLARFPTFSDLARASKADAIRGWQGLGYNLRAVRLHGIACQVVAEHGGELPRTVEGLLTLKGIGLYTAGAVACFAFGLPVAMVDTNVRRVLARVFDADPDQVAHRVVPKDAAYAWNQALMDLGATLCRADKPLCLLCPLNDVCCAVGQVIVRPRRKQPPFAGSSRYVRGRILDALRTQPDKAAVPLLQLAEVVSAEPSRVENLARRMAAEGLLTFDTDGSVHLP